MTIFPAGGGGGRHQHTRNKTKTHETPSACPSKGKTGSPVSHQNPEGPHASPRSTGAVRRHTNVPGEPGAAANRRHLRGEQPAACCLGAEGSLPSSGQQTTCEEAVHRLESKSKAAGLSWPDSARPAHAPATAPKASPGPPPGSPAWAEQGGEGAGAGTRARPSPGPGSHAHASPCACALSPQALPRELRYQAWQSCSGGTDAPGG